jgi:hypothetical protein
VSVGAGYEQEDRDRFPAISRSFSLLHSVQAGSGTHTASRTIGSGYSFA